MTSGPLPLILVGAAGSLALLLGALGFEHLGGLAPCQLCYWQRWPHMAAVAIGLGAAAAFAAGLRLGPIALAGAAAAAAAAGLGLYHTGVERGWWAGPAACSGDGGLGGLSGADLLDPGAAQALVMCDEVVWSLLGLSMASWNGILSLLLVLVWLAAARAAAVAR